MMGLECLFPLVVLFLFAWAMGSRSNEQTEQAAKYGTVEETQEANRQAWGWMLVGTVLLFIVLVLLASAGWVNDPRFGWS
jgi:asparagine N-glycosylation enzyme membrane subunit Stt3